MFVTPVSTCFGSMDVCAVSRVGSSPLRRQTRLQVATGKYVADSEVLPRGARLIGDAGLYDLGDLADATVAGLSERTGAVLWTNRGSRLHCNIDENDRPVRCRARGIETFERGHTGMFEGLDVTLEGFDQPAVRRRGPSPSVPPRRLSMGQWSCQLPVRRTSSRTGPTVLLSSTTRPARHRPSRRMRRSGAPRERRTRSSHPTNGAMGSHTTGEPAAGSPRSATRRAIPPRRCRAWSRPSLSAPRSAAASWSPLTTASLVPGALKPLRQRSLRRSRPDAERGAHGAVTGWKAGYQRTIACPKARRMATRSADDTSAMAAHLIAPRVARFHGLRSRRRCSLRPHACSQPSA
jgi:hypothetical protein